MKENIINILGEIDDCVKSGQEYDWWKQKLIAEIEKLEKIKERAKEYLELRQFQLGKGTLTYHELKIQRAIADYEKGN